MGLLRNFQLHNQKLLVKRSRTGKRGILGIHIGWLCRIISNYNPNWCRHCTNCQDVKSGYTHKKGCYCEKVQYEK
jgi:hypothetical protein